MKHRTRLTRRAHWREWAILGLLVTLSFLAHDLGMIGLAPGSELRFVTNAGAGVNAQVVHVATARDSETTHATTLHQHRGDGDEPAQSGCEITWVAVPAVNDTLDATLLAILNQIESTVPGSSVSRSPCVADAALHWARNQRSLFQVFLI